MAAKKDLWLTIEEIFLKYPNLCNNEPDFDEFIGTLYDAGLLRGYYDRRKRKVFILEEAWIDLLNHRNYNLYIQMEGSDTMKFSVPAYCGSKFPKTYQYDKYWYTPTEILEEYWQLGEIPAFKVSLISKLVKTGIVRGKINSSEPHVLVLLPSFVELLKYRDWVIKKNLINLGGDY